MSCSELRRAGAEYLVAQFGVALLTARGLVALIHVVSWRIKRILRLGLRSPGAALGNDGLEPLHRAEDFPLQVQVSSFVGVLLRTRPFFLIPAEPRGLLLRRVQAHVL